MYAIRSYYEELRAQGKNVLSFSAGEPDFPTPRIIKDAAIHAIETDKTRYTAVDGIPELKRAVIEKLKRDNGLHYEMNVITSYSIHYTKLYESDRHRSMVVESSAYAVFSNSRPTLSPA